MLRRSLTVASLIGTILNLINQGDAYLVGVGLVWWKVILTYSVPFAISSFGSYSSFRASQDGSDDLRQ